MINFKNSKKFYEFNKKLESQQKSLKNPEELKRLKENQEVYKQIMVLF